MAANQHNFSLRRLWWLIRNDIDLNKSTIFTITITISAILLLFNLLFPRNIASVSVVPTGYYWLLFFGGIWITSMTFRNMHDKRKSYFTLTLPCSNMERFFAGFLETAILYPMAALLFYTLFYWFIAAISYLIFGTFYFITTPFLPETWHVILIYIILQSPFLLGSIYFKSHSMTKTVLVFALVGIAFLFVAFILARIFLGGVVVTSSILSSTVHHLGHTYFSVLRTVLFVCLAPLCWVITYFRIKEIETK